MTSMHSWRIIAKFHTELVSMYMINDYAGNDILRGALSLHGILNTVNYTKRIDGSAVKAMMENPNSNVTGITKDTIKHIHIRIFPIFKQKRN